ncbi:MAG: hypothetical protein KF753_11450 [Caldilineaceae bacterium]|nr:hypothetical protein [Caldilineaceae bacterium]
MFFYHGTDIDSALDILNDGLSVERLRLLQSLRQTQLGPGLYVTEDPETAWFFASLAPGNRGRGYTVLEIELADSAFEKLRRNGFVYVEEIVNVPFRAMQYRFALTAFAEINAQAIFRPFRRQE